MHETSQCQIDKSHIFIEPNNTKKTPVLLYFWKSHFSEKTSLEGIERTLTLEIKKKLLIIFNQKSKNNDCLISDTSKGLEGSVSELFSKVSSEDVCKTEKEEEEQQQFKTRDICNHIERSTFMETNGEFSFDIYGSFAYKYKFKFQFFNHLCIIDKNYVVEIVELISKYIMSVIMYRVPNIYSCWDL